MNRPGKHAKPNGPDGTRGGADAARRQPLGIPGLDALLGGGLPEGNAVLVQGAPGTGKTVLGMQFLAAGATRLDEPGLLVTFEEPPRRLYRDARALGWDFEQLEAERRLLVVFTSPDVFLKELEADVYAQMIRDYGLRRVVVDSLTHFEKMPNAADQARARFERIINALRRHGLSIFLTREMETRSPITRVTPEEYIADTIIQLDYCLVGDRRERLIEVLKHRGSSHADAPHRFIIAAGGLQIIAQLQGSL